MPANFFNEVFLAGNNSGLRAAQKFVAAENDERDLGFEALANGWLGDSKLRQIKQAAGAKVFHQRKICLLAEGNEFGKRWLVRKTAHLKIRRMYTHQYARFFVYGTFIVFDFSAIRCTDFAEY